MRITSQVWMTSLVLLTACGGDHSGVPSQNPNAPAPAPIAPTEPNTAPAPAATPSVTDNDALPPSDGTTNPSPSTPPSFPNDGTSPGFPPPRGDNEPPKDFADHPIVVRFREAGIAISFDPFLLNAQRLAGLTFLESFPEDVLRRQPDIQKLVIQYNPWQYDVEALTLRMPFRGSANDAIRYLDANDARIDFERSLDGMRLVFNQESPEVFARMLPTLSEVRAELMSHRAIIGTVRIGQTNLLDYNQSQLTLSLRTTLKAREIRKFLEKIDLRYSVQKSLEGIEVRDGTYDFGMRGELDRGYVLLDDVKEALVDFRGFVSEIRLVSAAEFTQGADFAPTGLLRVGSDFKKKDLLNFLGGLAIQRELQKDLGLVISQSEDVAYYKQYVTGIQLLRSLRAQVASSGVKQIVIAQKALTRIDPKTGVLTLNLRDKPERIISALAAKLP